MEQPGNNGSGAIPEGNTINQRHEMSHGLVEKKLATLERTKVGRVEARRMMATGDAI
jgi:hypothetical protein